MELFEIEIFDIIDAGHFWARPVWQDGSEQQDFMGRLNDYFQCGAGKKASTFIPKKGQMCVIRRTSDHHWYRARVQNLMQTMSGTQASVLLVDLAEATLVPCFWIREVPPDFQKIPFQAMECFLAGVKPLSLHTYFDGTTSAQASNHWDKSSNEHFKNLVKGRKLQLKVISEDDEGTVQVLLYAEKERQQICVNDELVKSNFAVSTEERVGQSSNHGAYKRRQEVIQIQQEQFQRAQQDMFRSFKETVQLEINNDSGSEDLFSSQQRTDVNFGNHPSRDLICLEYLKQQFGNEKRISDFSSHYCSPPTARIPGSWCHNSVAYRVPLTKTEDISRQSVTTSSLNLNINSKSPIPLCIQNGTIVSTSQSSSLGSSTTKSCGDSSVKPPSLSASIIGPSGVEAPWTAYRPSAANNTSANALPSNKSEATTSYQVKGSFGTDYQAKPERSSDHDSFNCKRSTLSSDEESSGRVRFLSARLPATGKVSPGDVSVGRDAVNLKPILKKEGRSPKSPEGTSSDQESPPSRKNVRIIDPVVVNFAKMFTYQVSEVSARIPGTSRVSTSSGSIPETRNHSPPETAKIPNVIQQEATFSSLSKLSVVDNTQTIDCKDSSTEANLSKSQINMNSFSAQKRIDSEEQTLKSKIPEKSSPSTQRQISPTKKPPILPSQLLSPVSPQQESEDSLIEWHSGVMICGDGTPMPYDLLSNSPLSDYASKLENIPTAIQACAWPAVFRGRDVAAISPSNSGKTRAYLLPIFKALQDPTCYTKLPMSNGPIVLILTPFWNQARKIYHEAIELTGKLRRLRVHVVYGGGKEQEQAVYLINGCDVLVATPACFLRLLKKRYTSLDKLCHLVVDDADIMVEEFTAELKELMRFYGKLLASNPKRDLPRQTVVMSRTWTVGLASFVRAYLGNPLVLIADKCEAAVFNNVKQIVNFCQSSQRDILLLGILGEDLFQRNQDTIVFTATAKQAEQLLEKLEAYSIYALLVTEYMEQEELKDVKRQWNTPHATDSMPVLVMSDQVVEKLSIKNASCIIHYDFPASKSKLGNRLGCLATSERSATSKEFECQSIMFITEKPECRKHSVALVEFLRRANQQVPRCLVEDIANPMMDAKEEMKKHIGLCTALEAFGECREKRKCSMRHKLFAEVDTPVDIPTSGIVKVLILEICDASCYWVRVLSHVKPDDSPCDNKKCLCDNTRFLKLSTDISLWFADSANQVKHGIPQKNDLCATLLGNSHHRVKVCEIIKRDQGAQPFQVKVLFVDLGVVGGVDVDKILKLPAQFHDMPFQAIQAYICRIQPVDKDMFWTDQAFNFVKRLIEGKELQGRVALSIGRTMWLDPLVERAVLKGINVTTNLNNVRLELLREGKAVENKQHLKKLRALCENVIDLSSYSKGVSDVPALLDTVELKEEGYQDVYVSAVEDPGLFYVQLSTSLNSLDELRERIDGDINRMDAEAGDIDIGSLCVAQFTQDDKWYRARVQGTRPGNEYDVFYVDYGDREWVTKDRIRPPWRDILQLPLQAIECSLGNVVPLDNEWSGDNSDAFWELVKDKVLVCKVTSKVGSLIAGCHKYIVELFDTSSEHDVVMSRELVVGGHAQTSPECMQTLFPEAVMADSSEECEDPVEKITLAEEIQTIVINSSCAKDVIRECGGVKCLCRLLNVTRGPTIQEHLIVALGNLAFENESNCDYIRREGGLKALCYLLTKTQHVGVQANIAWALKNIVMNNDRNQSEVRELGGINSLCQLLSDTTDEKVQENIAWAFVSLAKDNDRISEAIKTAGGLKTLCELIAKTNNNSLVERCTWAVAELSADLRNRNLVRQYGGIEALCKKIEHLSNEQIQSGQQELLRHAVQALKTLVNNNQHNRDVMRDLGMIATLRRLTLGTSDCWRITRRLCQDLHQRLIGWTFGGLGLSIPQAPTSQLTNGHAPPLQSNLLKTKMQKHDGQSPLKDDAAAADDDDYDEMPPLEGDDEEQEPPQTHSTRRLLGQDASSTITNVLHPTTVWSQTKEIVRVCVRLRGVEHHDKSIGEERLYFRTVIGRTSYELDLKLFDKVDPKESKVLVKGSEVYIALRKINSKAWPRLVKDEAKLRYISVDFDRWEVWSSSEEDDDEAKKKKQLKEKMYKELLVQRQKRQRKKKTNKVILPEMDISDSSNSNEDNSSNEDFDDFFDFS